MKKTSRYFYSIINLKPSQTLYRIITYFWKPLSFNLIILKNDNKEHNFFYLKRDFIETSLYTNTTNEFVFLNKKKIFENEIQWNNNDETSLWNFNLNYFDFLNDLIALYEEYNDINYLDKGKKYVNSWIDCSNKYNNIMWSPYTISLRLLNWVSFYSYLIEKKLVEKIPFSILRSIIKQEKYLSLNLEYDEIGRAHV